MFTPAAGPPSLEPPHPAIFAALGVDGITALVRAVYRNIGQSPIASMFPQGEAALMAAADKSALFWVTICGGPPLYAETYGPPMMRKRHFGFAITAEARTQWLACWDPVLETAPEQFGFPSEHLAGFKAWMEGFAGWMVNTED